VLVQLELVWELVLVLVWELVWELVLVQLVRVQPVRVPPVSQDLPRLVEQLELEGSTTLTRKHQNLFSPEK
jgi:hypothetical protein